MKGLLQFSFEIFSNNEKCLSFKISQVFLAKIPSNFHPNLYSCCLFVTTSFSIETQASWIECAEPTPFPASATFSLYAFYTFQPFFFSASLISHSPIFYFSLSISFPQFLSLMFVGNFFLAPLTCFTIPGLSHWEYIISKKPNFV